jgi:hypothetical protein
MKHIALGVNVGNLSRRKTRREPMLARCDRINRNLATENADLRVIGFYRHTGNLVLKTTTLEPAQAAQILSQADGGTWMAVSEATMRKTVREVHKLQAPDANEAYGGRPVLHLRSRNPGAAISLHRQKCAFTRSISAWWQCGSAIEPGNADDLIAKCGRAVGGLYRERLQTRPIPDGRRGASRP